MKFKDTFFYRTWEERFWNIKDRFSWVEGRQGNSLYQKIEIFTSNIFKIDAYLLKIPIGPGVQPHVDPCDQSLVHKRLNLFLKLPKDGGKVHIDGPYKSFFFNRIHQFSASKYNHWIDPVISGEMIVLSIGWLSYDR